VDQVLSSKPNNRAAFFYLGVARMEGEQRKRWEEVAKQAVTEQDQDKFMALIRELNELLREKEQRLGIIAPDKEG
jgi:hypothetical protein